jgi:N6-adenosine-specific RNA methylase IME4
VNDLAVAPKTEREVVAKQSAVLMRVEDGPLSAEEAAANENMLAALEEMARRSGLVSETIQVEVWLTRFLNRWRLGEALRALKRGGGPGRGKKIVGSDNLFMATTKRLRLARESIVEVQRLACMPWAEALKYRDMARERPDWRTFAAGLAYARRWWTKERHLERLEEIGIAAALEMLGLRYPIILADPPWRYENPPMGGGNRSIENHYPTMALDEICALPIEDIAASDSTLYLWATAPKLAECFKVLDAWGFIYRTNFVWIKDKIGMGYHARSQHELLLVAKRGNLPPPAAEERVSSVIHADRGEHSKKPAIFHELIDRWYPDLPKVELFARVGRPGWATWGNQATEAA